MYAFAWCNRHTVSKSEQRIVLTQVVGHRKCLSWSGCACVARHLKRGCDIFERKSTVSATNMMSGALCCWQHVNIIVSTWDRKGGCRLSGCQGRKVGATGWMGCARVDRGYNAWSQSHLFSRPFYDRVVVPRQNQRRLQLTMRCGRIHTTTCHEHQDLSRVSKLAQCKSPGRMPDRCKSCGC